MDEKMMADAGAGESLRGPSDEGGETVGREDTYFLPAAVAEGRDVKPGDVLRFKVVGKDGDGQIEVECMDDADKTGGQKSWQDDVRASVSPETNSQAGGY